MTGPKGEEPHPLSRAGLEKALAFIDDGEARVQIVDRFVGQYAPAILKAGTAAAAERAWESFRYYVTAPATRRKPFALGWDEAQRLLDILQGLLRTVPGGTSGDG